MNLLTTAGICLVTGTIGFFVGGFIGVAVNTSHDDLGFGEGLSMLFGAGIGVVIGVFIGALVATEIVP